MSRAVMQQALDALVDVARDLATSQCAALYAALGDRSPQRHAAAQREVDQIETAIEALRAALAQPDEVPDGCTPADAMVLRDANHALAMELHAAKAALARQGEPVAWLHCPPDSLFGARLSMGPARFDEEVRRGWRVRPLVFGDAAPAPMAQPDHHDDAAVDRFAAAMKAKLADARAKGRSGWQTCSPEALSEMLRDHVEKGDPRDVANFCMFLWALGSGIKLPMPGSDAFDRWVGAGMGRAALAPVAQHDGTDWKAIARVQSAKLHAALDEPGAVERLKAALQETRLDAPAPVALTQAQQHADELLEALQDAADLLDAYCEGMDKEARDGFRDVLAKIKATGQEGGAT